MTTKSKALLLVTAALVLGLVGVTTLRVDRGQRVDQPPIRVGEVPDGTSSRAVGSHEKSDEQIRYGIAGVTRIGNDPAPAAIEVFAAGKSHATDSGGDSMKVVLGQPW